MMNVANYVPREVTIDGCTYKEGLNIVHLESGVATNTIPDEAWMFVNFRFAPDRSLPRSWRRRVRRAALDHRATTPGDPFVGVPGR